MQNIVPCLWFDADAEEAAEFYVSVFGEGKVLKTQQYLVETPSKLPVGSTMTVDFELFGYRFLGLNGGPFFTANPSISFFVHRPSKEQITAIWERLAEEGEVLMPLDSYPFSDWYGWVQDKYGFSWQLILPKVPEGEGSPRPTIVACQLFVGDVCGQSRDAMELYTSVFDDSQIGDVANYGEDQQQEDPEHIMYGDFRILGQWFACMDSALDHDFDFNEAVSYMVYCRDQDQIDYYYDRLSAVPEAEMCGWLKDCFGVSWQLVTEELDELLDDEQAMSALMEMKRIDVSRLRKARSGE